VEQATEAILGRLRDHRFDPPLKGQRESPEDVLLVDMSASPAMLEVAEAAICRALWRLGDDLRDPGTDPLAPRAAVHRLLRVIDVADVSGAASTLVGLVASGAFVGHPDLLGRSLHDRAVALLARFHQAVDERLPLESFLLPLLDRPDTCMLAFRAIRTTQGFERACRWVPRLVRTLRRHDEASDLSEPLGLLLPTGGVALGQALVRLATELSRASVEDCEAVAEAVARLTGLAASPVGAFATWRALVARVVAAYPVRVAGAAALLRFHDQGVRAIRALRGTGAVPVGGDRGLPLAYVERLRERDRLLHQLVQHEEDDLRDDLDAWANFGWSCARLVEPGLDGAPDLDLRFLLACADARSTPVATFVERCGDFLTYHDHERMLQADLTEAVVRFRDACSRARG
jgi:hypothetical protein